MKHIQFCGAVYTYNKYSTIQKRQNYIAFVLSSTYKFNILVNNEHIYHVCQSTILQFYNICSIWTLRTVERLLLVQIWWLISSTILYSIVILTWNQNSNRNNIGRIIAKKINFYNGCMSCQQTSFFGK